MRSGDLKDAVYTQLSSAHRIVTIRQREKIIFQKRVTPPQIWHIWGGVGPHSQNGPATLVKKYNLFWALKITHILRGRHFDREPR